MTLLEAIKASAFIMAKNDVRYFLNGIHIVKRDGVVTVESTDGCMAFQTRDVDADNVKGEEVDIIIPRETVEIVKKAKLLILEGNTFTTDSGTVTFEPVGGNYPQIDRVIPSRTADVAQVDIYSINPEYTMAVGKSYRACTGKKDYSGLISRNIAGGSGLSSVLMYPLTHELSHTNWIVMPIRIGG